DAGFGTYHPQHLRPLPDRERRRDARRALPPDRKEPSDSGRSWGTPASRSSARTTTSAPSGPARTSTGGTAEPTASASPFRPISCLTTRITDRRGTFPPAGSLQKDTPRTHRAPPRP